MQMENNASTNGSFDVNNNVNSSFSNSKSKVVKFIRRNLKQPLSRYTNDSAVVDSVKSYGNIFSLTIRDVYRLFRAFFSLIYSSTFGFFATLKLFKNESKKAAKNHFHIGLEMLKRNNILDARMRFLMSNMMFRKSPTTKYYIAYTYFLSNNYKKSLKYLKDGLFINNQHHKSIELVKQIEYILSQQV